MRIVVLAHSLHTGGGITVGQSIISALLKVAPEHEYLITVPRGCCPVAADAQVGVTFVEGVYHPLVSRIIWEKQCLNRLLTHFRPDWLWGLGNLAYPSIKCRQSVLLQNAHRVVHHSGFRQSLTFTRRLIERYLDWRVKRDFIFADRGYCQTETMRKEVAKVFGIPLSKIGLCPNAIKSDFKQVVEVPAELKQFSGCKFLMLVPTRYYPHKNLELLIETYARHREKLAGTVCILLVSEDQGLGARRFMEMVRRETLESQLICLGARPQEMMPQFYSAADAMLLPTDLESFSGSYIEAMWFGRPILTTRLPFAQELCGDAAIYFNHNDPDDVCRAILELMNDSNRRTQLVSSGKDTVRTMLSWPEIVSNVLHDEGISHRHPEMEKLETGYCS